MGDAGNGVGVGKVGHQLRVFAVLRILEFLWFLEGLATEKAGIRSALAVDERHEAGIGELQLAVVRDCHFNGEFHLFFPTHIEHVNRQAAYKPAALRPAQVLTPTGLFERAHHVLSKKDRGAAPEIIFVAVTPYLFFKGNLAAGVGFRIIGFANDVLRQGQPHIRCFF